jgi:S-adenosylmethionine:tRNA ribosyltransferase-isomerase
VGNAKRWKGGEIRATGDGLTLRATRTGTRGEETRVRFEWDAPLSFGEVLERLGRVPIPPYLNREATGIDEMRYQTVYSRHEGSVAAPTAGLHFSEELLRQARATGATLAEVTLHVGAGTFKPVKAGRIGEHEMHTERVLFSRQLVEQLVRAPREVIAVGTTSARSLESLYWMGVKRLHGMPAFNTLGQWEAYTLPGGHPAREAWGALARWFDEEGASRLEARSTLMIVPGYKFRVVTGLFTNFHQPRSTLLLLVAVAIGEEWRRVYDHALTRGYRFLSYGDGSFLEVAKENRV